MTALDRLPARLAALAGWHRLGVAALFGCALALALPPFVVLVAAVVGLTGFAWLLDGASGPRRGFFDGWAFGAGFSAAGLYWIANALLVDAARFGWMVPFALLLIALGFGLFGAAAAALATAVPRGAPRYVALGLAWLVLEWVRSWILTGFPWNLLGTAFALSDELLQGAAWGGPWLLSALLLAVALWPAVVVDLMSGPMLRRLAWGFAGSLAVVAVLHGLGAWRLAAHPVATTDTRLRLVQASIPQADKWRRDLLDSHFATQIALSLSQSAVAPDVIVWPEAAIPWSLLREPARRAEAGAVVGPGGLLLAGAVRFDRAADGTALPRNSLIAMDGSGAVVATYDKQHLVPFGEYVPLRGILPVDKITPGATDFVQGDGPGVLQIGRIPPFRGLICYEVIFPAEIADGGSRPAWLLNVTNDGWYGISTGPFQHLVAARLRAVEQGLPLVRAANNGISAVIDPFGRVVASLPLDAVGVVDAALPAALPAPTPYARWGDLLLLVPVVAGLPILAWGLRCRRRAGDGPAR